MMQDLRIPELPVAAVTTTAASPTATTAASAAVTSAPATASSMTSAVATAAATTATFALRACFVDDECAAQKFPPVESRDDLFRFRIVSNFGESETARLARESIAKQRERIRLHARFGK
jgi:hypothetical protein